MGSGGRRRSARRGRRRRHRCRGPVVARRSSTRSPSASSADWPSTTSPGVAWCSAAASSSINDPASTSISWISGSPATKRRALPTTMATLSRQTEHGAGRADELAVALHRLLHGERARRPADAVVTVDPAGDGIAAEVDDDAAAACSSPISAWKMRSSTAVSSSAPRCGPSSAASISVTVVNPEMSANSAVPSTRSGSWRPSRMARRRSRAMNAPANPDVAADGADVGGLHPTTRMPSSVGQRRARPTRRRRARAPCPGEGRRRRRPRAGGGCGWPSAGSCRPSTPGRPGAAGSRPAGCRRTARRARRAAAPCAARPGRYSASTRCADSRRTCAARTSTSIRSTDGWTRRSSSKCWRWSVRASTGSRATALAVRTVSVVEQRLLAEALARSEHGQRRHVAERRRHADGDPPALEDVQQVAGLALVEQRVALAVAAPHHRRQHRPPIVVGERAQHVVLARSAPQAAR